MPSTFSKIVIPVDFSPLSRKALGHAFALAGPETRVELVHATEPLAYPHPSLWTGGLARLSELMEQTQAQAKASLKALQKELAAAHPGVALGASAVAGQPAEAVAELAREQKADLIVMSTHGRSGLSHVLLGSVAERLLALAPCPVLVTRPEGAGPPPLKRFLVAVDRSEHSGRALQLAARMAQSFDATITVVHAWPAPFFDETQELDGALFERIRQAAREELEAFIEGLQLPSGLKIESHIVPGEVGSSVQQQIAERKPDLLFLGTHGRHGLKRLLLGSVAQSAVRYSPCSAVVVP